MSALATPASEVEDDIFNAPSYDLNIPATEGKKAQRISVRFTGSCELDRTSEDDLVFLEAMRLGVPVRLVITGLPVGKGFSLKVAQDPTDGELAYHSAVRVTAVELGELA